MLEALWEKLRNGIGKAILALLLLIALLALAYLQFAGNQNEGLVNVLSGAIFFLVLCLLPSKSA